MIYIKKTIILALVFAFSFLFIEILIRMTLNHPTYNIEKKLYGLRKSDDGITDIYFPNSRFWTTEGGYSISTTNNLGLPGSDIKVTDTTKFVYLLGSSYLQANQVKKNKTASYLLQQKLGFNSIYQIINLGEGGLDQYDSYFKIKYYSQYYKPEKIFLIIERVDDRWLSRHDTLNFDSDPRFGQQVQNNITGEIEILLRKNSAFINLLSNGYKIMSKSMGNTGVKRAPLNDPNKTDTANISKRLLQCFKVFKIEYASKFSVLSIIDNQNINNYLNSFCKDNKIEFHYQNINRAENQIKKNGHLNEKGNEELGLFLNDVLKKTYPNNE